MALLLDQKRGVDYVPLGRLNTTDCWDSIVSDFELQALLVLTPQLREFVVAGKSIKYPECISTPKYLEEIEELEEKIRNHTEKKNLKNPTLWEGFDWGRNDTSSSVWYDLSDTSGAAMRYYDNYATSSSMGSYNMSGDIELFKLVKKLQALETWSERENITIKFCRYGYHLIGAMSDNHLSIIGDDDYSNTEEFIYVHK